MSFFEFPYTRTYSSDLGWLIRQVKWLTDEIENKTIKYADPIAWDITQQYEKNTVVLDGNIAYLSKEAVPSGVAITNTDYWQPVFDMTPLFDLAANLRDQISANYETSYTSAHTYSAGDWLFVLDNHDYLLYRAMQTINVNDGLVPGYNISKTTVEYMSHYIINVVGRLADLNTTDKSSIVNAINDVLAGLTQEITDRGTADTAINNKIGSLSSLTTSDKTSIVNAINELDGDIGDLSTLNTSDKSSTVNAIIEVYNGVLNNGYKLQRMKNVLIIGDSYSRPSFVPAGLEWYNLLAARDEYTIFNYSVGGSGFVYHQSGSVYIDDEINNAINNIGDADSIGHVILYAGYNDFALNATHDQIYAAVRTSIQAIKAGFPYADIIFVPLNMAFNEYRLYWECEFLAAMVDAGHDEGVFTYEYAPFMFCHEELGACMNGSHPNELGNEIEYSIMRNLLLGDNEPPTYRKLLAPTEWEGVTVLNHCYGWFEQKGYKYHYQLHFNCAAGTYEGVYRVAKLVRPDGTHWATPVAWYEHAVYDRYGLDYPTQYGVQITNNQKDGSIKFNFPSSTTWGGSSNGWFTIDGVLINRQTSN